MPNPFNPPSTITTYPFNVSLMAENTVLAYISSSYYNTGLLDPATQFYTGVGNSDIEGPAIVVACNHAAEAVFQSRVYRFDVDISTRMMAADSLVSPNVTSSAISFGGQIYSLFGETYSSCGGMNALETGLACIQAQVMDFRNERIDDAWISNLNLSLVAVPVSH